VDGSTTDGRLLKGARRRRALLDAAVRVMGQAGIAGVSQRVVAAEAGVPASAVPYYFPTVEDLLLAVLSDVNDRYIAGVQRCAEEPDPLVALARLIARATDPDARPSTAAEFELFMLAGRGGRWQQEYRRWADALDAFFAAAAGDAPATVAATLVDGLLVRNYCHPDPMGVAEIEAALRSVTGT
jgi:TetR/AcrR family transcriptional regulator, regulator of biofilm formation and stress response